MFDISVLLVLLIFDHLTQPMCITNLISRSFIFIAFSLSLFIVHVSHTHTHTHARTHTPHTRTHAQLPDITLVYQTYLFKISNFLIYIGLMYLNLLIFLNYLSFIWCLLENICIFFLLCGIILFNHIKVSGYYVYRHNCLS